MNKFYSLKVLEIEPLTADSVKVVFDNSNPDILILKLVNILPYVKRLMMKM